MKNGKCKKKIVSSLPNYWQSVWSLNENDDKLCVVYGKKKVNDKNWLFIGNYYQVLSGGCVNCTLSINYFFCRAGSMKRLLY